MENDGGDGQCGVDNGRCGDGASRIEMVVRDRGHAEDTKGTRWKQATTGPALVIEREQGKG